MNLFIFWCFLEYKSKNQHLYNSFANDEFDDFERGYRWPGQDFDKHEFNDYRLFEKDLPDKPFFDLKGPKLYSGKQLPTKYETYDNEVRSRHGDRDTYDTFRNLNRKVQRPRSNILAF
jgi:hypothetical protein